MNNHFDIQSWSRLYREQRLSEARTRHLEGQQRTARNRPTRLALSVAALMLVALLLVGSGCTSSNDDRLDIHTANSDDSASASPSPSVSSGASLSSGSSADTESSPASASTSADASVSATSSASASPDGSASASPSPDAARFAGMRSSGSWECYTFYSDGTVELRHGGTSTVSDSGSYQGDEDFGEIVWDSGRWTSTVVAEGDGLIIDDLKVSPVTSCF
jgi:hypothetical protein